MLEPSRKRKERLQVGAFAKRVGKTVRAMHLYEELGLLTPVERSKGGFRLYDETSIERARWIVKLQSIGFTLAQIQRFVADFESVETGRVPNNQARLVFAKKLSKVETQLAKLQRNKSDLVEAIDYLDGRRNYASDVSPANSEQRHRTDEDAHHLEASIEHAARQESSAT